MLLAFGALIAAGIPVLLAVSSVAATIGIAAPLSHFVPAEPTVSSMIVLIGMAVGVDYSLFYLKREREERARGRTTLDAVEIAAQTSGHSILVSGWRGHRLDGGPLPGRRRHLQLPRHSARSSWSRWPSSARSRCSPRCWSSSVAGSTGRGCRCSGGSTAASAAAGSAAGSSPRSYATRRPRWPRPASWSSALAVPALGMTMHASGTLQTLPAASRPPTPSARCAESSPAEGTTVTVVARGDDARSRALPPLESTAADAATSRRRPRSRRRRGRRHVHADHVAALPRVRRRSAAAINHLRDDLAPAAFAGSTPSARWAGPRADPRLRRPPASVDAGA